jgi:hypothetical protein
MNKKYLPKDRDARLFHVIEEVAEVVTEAMKVLKTIGKAGRFGMSDIDPKRKKTNCKILLAEMKDLRNAVARCIPDLEEYT